MGLDPASVVAATATAVAVLNGLALLLLKAGDRRDPRQRALEDAEQASILTAASRHSYAASGGARS